MQYRSVTDADPTLTLSAADVEVTVHPRDGARIGQITVAGQPVLVDVPPPGDRHPMLWGSFPMVPWAGRIRAGRFTFDGVERHLPINHHDGDGDERAHAIHGLAFDRPWDVRTVPGTGWTARIDFDWEFGGMATQSIAVFADRIEARLTIESTGATFPAELGWHPWFRRPDRLGFAPTAMYGRDAVGLPTGELVEPSAGPWDDCFPYTDPIDLIYDRPVAPVVRVASDCDHRVVFDRMDHATCVEPQSGPPDAFNLSPHVVTPAAPLTRTMTISW